MPPDWEGRNRTLKHLIQSQVALPICVLPKVIGQDASNSQGFIGLVMTVCTEPVEVRSSFDKLRTNGKTFKMRIAIQDAEVGVEPTSPRFRVAATFQIVHSARNGCPCRNP